MEMRTRCRSRSKCRHRSTCRTLFLDILLLTHTRHFTGNDSPQLHPTIFWWESFRGVLFPKVCGSFLLISILLRMSMFLHVMNLVSLSISKVAKLPVRHVLSLFILCHFHQLQKRTMILPRRSSSCSDCQIPNI